ncbi:MAG: LysR family transcriptional regulator [Myxococcaceae bacterium]|jgi:DNA-binding transcriptional LysR family regulator|nr:LysR family transcriptional regulator [Myxococcaceae bacterium]
MEIDDLTWDDLRVLLAVHRHQSFLSAGKALGQSTSTTARRLDRLEAALGRRLVVRSTSGTSLEPTALPLVALAEQVELGLAEVGRRAEGAAGVVRLSTGDGFARALTPVLAALRRVHPGLSIELVAEARLADVARGEADVAVRTARSQSAVLVEKPLGRLHFALYASSRYVEERLRTTTLGRDDLARADVIAHTKDLAGLPQNVWLSQLGAQRFVFRSNADAVLVEAAKASQGVAVLAELVGNAEKDLVRLTTPLPGPSVPVWLVFQRASRDVPRVRLVVDAITAAFRAAL